VERISEKTEKIQRENHKIVGNFRYRKRAVYKKKDKGCDPRKKTSKEKCEIRN
jgi:hypothetical protein